MTVIQCDICGAIMPTTDAGLSVFELRLPNRPFSRKIYAATQLCRACATIELRRFHKDFPAEEVFIVEDDE